MFTNEAVGSRLAIGYSKKKETAECSANVRSNIYFYVFPIVYVTVYWRTAHRNHFFMLKCQRFCLLVVAFQAVAKRFSRSEFRKKICKGDFLSADGLFHGLSC